MSEHVKDQTLPQAYDRSGAQIPNCIVDQGKERTGGCQPRFQARSKERSLCQTNQGRVGDKGYDDEDIHEFLREELHVDSIIPPRNESVPVRRTKGKVPKADEEVLLRQEVPSEF